MGSSTSKPAKAAAGAAARKYPSRPSPPQTNAPARQPPPAANGNPGPTVRPQARASAERDEAINLDASDPDFARSLRSLGPVQPNPTLSPSSAFPQHQQQSLHPSSSPYQYPTPSPYPQQQSQHLNPALRVLQARSSLADEADKEFLEAGRRGHAGRRFLDIGTVRQVLMLRDLRGIEPKEIERSLGLKSGSVGKLGIRGLVGV